MGGTRPQALPGPATIWQMFKPLLIKYQGSMKLTKKEKDFLLDWLSEDFDLALKEFMDSSEVDFTPSLKNLKSIIKKLINEKKN